MLLLMLLWESKRKCVLLHGSSIDDKHWFSHGAQPEHFQASILVPLLVMYPCAHTMQEP